MANGGTAAVTLPADGPAAPPAAAAADFLAGLERQLVHATARSAADGGSDGTAAVVADIQRQLLELKQQLLAQQQQQPVAAAPAHPVWHASSSSGDHLSPYAGPAMHGRLHPSPPLPAWQLQQGGFLPGPAHQALPAAASPRQAWPGESASPRAPSQGLGRRPNRRASRSRSPRRQRQGPLAEPPLVPAAICHFKFGYKVRWELVGREVRGTGRENAGPSVHGPCAMHPVVWQACLLSTWMPAETLPCCSAGLLGSLSSCISARVLLLLIQLYVSGLPACDGVPVHRREAARRLSALIESTGTAGTLLCVLSLPGQRTTCITLQGKARMLHFPQGIHKATLAAACCMAGCVCY